MPPYCALWVFGISTWPIGCDSPSPFFWAFPPLNSKRSGGAIPHPQKGYLSNTRKQGKTHAISPSAILSRKGIARFGGASSIGPNRLIALGVKSRSWGLRESKALQEIRGFNPWLAHILVCKKKLEKWQKCKRERIRHSCVLRLEASRLLRVHLKMWGGVGLTDRPKRVGPEVFTEPQPGSTSFPLSFPCFPRGSCRERACL